MWATAATGSPFSCPRPGLASGWPWSSRRLSQAAEVYVNGQLAGSHKGGYTPFVVDMTELLRPGENLVFVRVNNLWDSRQAPRAGEHVFNGGIYRDVSLLVTDPVRVALGGHLGDQRPRPPGAGAGGGADRGGEPHRPE